MRYNPLAKRAAMAERKWKKRKKKIKINPKPSPTRIDFYYTRDWKELRYRTLRRFGFKCMTCNVNDKPLHVVI